MKILAMGCFHGKVPKDLPEFCKENDIDIVFFLGDYAEGSEIRKWEFKNWKEIGYRVEAGQTFEEIVADMVGKKRYQRWEELAQKRGMLVLEELADLGVPAAYIQGNHDDASIIKKFVGDNFIHDRIFSIENMTVAAYGNFRGATSKKHQHIMNKKHMNPKSVKRIKQTNDRVKKEFDKLFKKRPDILLLHDPPYGTKCDKAGRGSPNPGEHIGDDIARSMILKYKPKMVLCAHVHEARGVDKIGKTVVINTGLGGEGYGVIVGVPSLHYKMVKIQLQKKSRSRKT